MSEDRFDQLVDIVRGLDERFPDGQQIYQRVSRLCEESGELASAVNHAEGMGAKRRKLGEPDPAQLAKEVQDVIRSALGIALHYGLVDEVKSSIDRSWQELATWRDEHSS